MAIDTLASKSNQICQEICLQRKNKLCASCKHERLVLLIEWFGKSISKTQKILTKQIESIYFDSPVTSQLTMAMDCNYFF